MKLSVRDLPPIVSTNTYFILKGIPTIIYHHDYNFFENIDSSNFNTHRISHRNHVQIMSYVNVMFVMFQRVIEGAIEMSKNRFFSKVVAIMFLIHGYVFIFQTAWGK